MKNTLLSFIFPLISFLAPLLTSISLAEEPVTDVQATHPDLVNTSVPNQYRELRAIRFGIFLHYFCATPGCGQKYGMLINR